METAKGAREDVDELALQTTGNGVGKGLEVGVGVSEERQAAIVEALAGLVPPAERLRPQHLRALTSTLASRRALWEDLVVRDPDTRWSLPLFRSSSFDLWLLAWERDQDTDWHDHGGSSGSFAVADGAVLERHRTTSGSGLRTRTLVAGDAVSFGPAHVHDVVHTGEVPATTIHAYSPPLVVMTYYALGARGLVARETVAVDGPEGPRGQGGTDAAVAPLAARGRDAGIDGLLARTRAGLRRLDPLAAAAAIAEGAFLVDIRPVEQRAIEGEVPGAVVIARNVLEWRLDPRSDAKIPGLARADARVIVMCSEGYASSLAAASLRDIGLAQATDLDGGFVAWRAAGLPTTAGGAGR